MELPYAEIKSIQRAARNFEDRQYDDRRPSITLLHDRLWCISNRCGSTDKENVEAERSHVHENERQNFINGHDVL